MGLVRDIFTVYKTTKVVQIKSKCLACTYIILVTLVWAAFLKTYQLDLRQIYQKTCPIRGTFTSKVKGILTTEQYSTEELDVPNPELYKRIWDTQDIIHNTEAGFIVLTNVIITPNQKRGICTSGSPRIDCETDADCEVGTQNKDVTGIRTGHCSPNKKCELSAWCPLEFDKLPLNGTEALLKDTKNFTVLIKNSIEFPNCECKVLNCRGGLFKRRNILDNFTSNYLKTCRYDPDKHPFCPIFVLDDIVRWSGSRYDEVAITGAIFRIRVSWNCDFDWGNTIDDCLPKYTFARVDSSHALISPGFNYRSGLFHKGNYRTLSKRYSIQFLLEIAGEGKQFDFLLLVLAIGASIGLFALAPLICDFLFDIFCYLNSCGCHQCFGSFSKEIRYQDIDAFASLDKSKRRKVVEDLCAPVMLFDTRV